MLYVESDLRRPATPRSMQHLLGLLITIDVDVVVVVVVVIVAFLVAVRVVCNADLSASQGSVTPSGRLQPAF